MKKLTSIFLVLLILLPGLSKVIYLAYWNLDRAAIERAFCKNIDKPELECHGQCHLEETFEKIDESTGKDTDKNAPVWEKLLESLVYCSSTHELLIIKIIDIPDLYLLSCMEDRYLNNYHFSRIQSIFHPPCLV